MTTSDRKRANDLSMALGCVIYESLILAIAIRMWRTRKSRPKIPDLNWGEAQIALELILLKTRALVDFLGSRGNNPDDIRASDFGYRVTAGFKPLPQVFEKRSIDVALTFPGCGFVNHFRTLPKWTKVSTRMLRT